jgi:hypothetical protein
MGAVLLTRRDGKSPTLRAGRVPDLAAFRNGVLADRLGSDGRVIFSDVSQDLLDECRRIADRDEYRIA